MVMHFQQALKYSKGLGLRFGPEGERGEEWRVMAFLYFIPNSIKLSYHAN